MGLRVATSGDAEEHQGGEHCHVEQRYRQELQRRNGNAEESVSIFRPVGQRSLRHLLHKLNCAAAKFQNSNNPISFEPINLGAVEAEQAPEDVASVLA